MSRTRLQLTLILLGITLCLLLLQPQASAQNPTLTVDNSAIQHTISPYIYGVNLAEDDVAAMWQVPIHRYGGNALTRYNWQLDVYNIGNYWFFENFNNPDPGTLPVGSSADQFVAGNIAIGAESVIQTSLIGWTPKSRDLDCAFHWDVYGWQTDADWIVNWGCGNGIQGGTEVPITWNDPQDTSVAIDPTFTQQWIQHLQSQFGMAGNGGVNYYTLDNEPMIWHHNHRDVYQTLNTYANVRDLGFSYGAAIKATDPNAKVLGPGVWGWVSYFYSALDAATPDSNPDHDFYGMDFLPWYLSEMQQFEQDNGYRLLDYLDIHYYPQGYVDGVPIATGDAGSAETQALRLRSTKDLWDPTYTAESWINEPVYAIPRMKAWIDQYYPGTGLAITEYRWGALDHINGALAQADVLGIFGREDVDMAFLWDEPSLGEPGDFAFRLYRNYDGAGSTFGNLAVNAVSSDQDQLAIYAARQASGDVLTVMVINKTLGNLTTSIDFTGALPLSGNVERYRYSSADLNNIINATVTTNGSSLADTFPGESISLYVLPLETAPTAVTMGNQATTTHHPSMNSGYAAPLWLGALMLLMLTVLVSRRHNHKHTTGF